MLVIVCLFNYQFDYNKLIQTDLTESGIGLFVEKAMQPRLLALPTSEIIQAIKPIYLGSASN